MRRALYRYLRILPEKLLRDYGHKGPYTPEQVEATIKRNNTCSLEFAPHALAIFSDRASVEHLWRERGYKENFDQLRADVGNAFFGGDADFMAPDTAVHRSRDQWNSGGSGPSIQS